MARVLFCEPGLLELLAERRQIHAHLLQLLFELQHELPLFFERLLVGVVGGFLLVALLRQLLVLGELRLPLVFVVPAADQ